MISIQVSNNMLEEVEAGSLWSFYAGWSGGTRRWWRWQVLTWCCKSQELHGTANTGGGGGGGVYVQMRFATLQELTQECSHKVGSIMAHFAKINE
jgi:hypothetical protein